MPLSFTTKSDTFLDSLVGEKPLKTLGVAVSGGGDSVALLHWLADWADRRGRNIRAVTVDHGLRVEAVDEAGVVAQQCAELGVSHDTLHWTGWDGAGNLQDEARRARYRLMAEWAGEKDVADIALGHTLDDQAETVLMRLARGSGVDGLSAMSPERQSNGVRWLRPLLQTRRLVLRDYLRQIDVTWAEDPSNDDPKYDRVKTRAALEVLETLGITSEGLADTAKRMASVRQVLDQATYAAAKGMAEIRGGAVYLNVEKLFEAPPETRRRLVAHSLCWVSGNAYSPRRVPLAELEKDIRNGRTSTLHGCLNTLTGGYCIISREPAAVADLVSEIGDIWDDRWQITGPELPDLEIRILGDKGLKSCDSWRKMGLHRSVLLASPAVWSENALIAAPLAGFNPEWGAELTKGANDFLTSILSH